jgi:phage portal protein BeeE
MRSLTGCCTQNPACSAANSRGLYLLHRVSWLPAARARSSAYYWAHRAAVLQKAKVRYARRKAAAGVTTD